MSPHQSCLLRWNFESQHPWCLNMIAKMFVNHIHAPVMLKLEVSSWWWNSCPDLKTEGLTNILEICQETLAWHKNCEAWQFWEYVCHEWDTCHDTHSSNLRPVVFWKTEGLGACVSILYIRKSKCTKHHSLRPFLEVEMSKKCMLPWREARSEAKMHQTRQSQTTFGSWDVEKVTLPWREARSEVKMYKAPHAQTTFGSWDVEKLDAVVALSTFPSQTCNLSHFQKRWQA